jgi:hypothetical protein
MSLTSFNSYFNSCLPYLRSTANTKGLEELRVANQFNCRYLGSAIGQDQSSIGCPRNNQIFFRFEPKQTETQSVSVVFGLFWCFGPVSKQPKQTEFSRNKPKQTKIISKKRCLLGGPQNRKFFFSVRPETNQNSICFGSFSVCFFVKTTNFFRGCFGLFRCFGPVSKQPKQTELMVWGIKRLIF